MSTTNSDRRLLLGTIAWLIGSLLVSSATTAAEPLRWKFHVGDKFNYDVTQDMTINMNAGPAGQMVTILHQAFDMIWDVQGVNEAGEAVVQQSIKRVKMSMNGPTGQSFEYDSDAEGPAEGMAAMVAPMYDAMTTGEFEFTMTARGEIRDVKVPEKVLEEIKNSPGAAAMGDMATSEGLQKMIMQGALVLPEELPLVGESWSNSVTMNNPMTGKQRIDTSYKYDGTEEIDGVTMAVFRPTLKMGFEGNQAMQMKVTEQTSDGKVLFNQDAGRFDSITLHQITKMDITVAGQTMQQQIDQVIDVKVSPADADATAVSAAATESSE